MLEIGDFVKVEGHKGMGRIIDTTINRKHVYYKVMFECGKPSWFKSGQMTWVAGRGRGKTSKSSNRDKREPEVTKMNLVEFLKFMNKISITIEGKDYTPALVELKGKRIKKGDIISFVEKKTIIFA